MTEINGPEGCCYKGVVQGHQVDSAGELRMDAAGSLLVDALDAFLAVHRGAAQREAASTPKAMATGITMDKTGTRAVRAGAIVSCRIDPPSDTEASGTVTARLCDSGAEVWRATFRLDGKLPDRAPAAGTGAAASGWPPLRIMRVMRKHHCDQAGHVNVQVFMDLVDEAVGVLCADSQADAPRLQVVQARISFKRELFEGDLVSVHSGIRKVDAQGIDVVHGLVHQPSGQLACVVETRIARLDETGRPVAQRDAPPVPHEPEGAWPSLPLARPPSLPRVSASPGQSAVTTAVSVVDVWDSDGAGWLSMRAMVNLCSTGARQYLASIGLTGARFLGERMTVAAVDYLVEVHARPALGCNLTIRSALLSATAKSIRFSHHLMDSDDGKVYATVEIVGVMLDLKTHRSMEIPADVRKRLGLPAD